MIHSPNFFHGGRHLGKYARDTLQGFHVISRNFARNFRGSCWPNGHFRGISRNSARNVMAERTLSFRCPNVRLWSPVQDAAAAAALMVERMVLNDPPITTKWFWTRLKHVTSLGRFYKSANVNYPHRLTVSTCPSGFCISLVCLKTDRLLISRCVSNKWCEES